MKKFFFIFYFSLFVIHFASAKEPADWVNAFIGTTNKGVTNPGAVVPNGMASVVPFNVAGGSPDNRFDRDSLWWSAPYEFHNRWLTGFSHVNLSGVGCPDLGSLLVMATTGELDVDWRTYGSRMTDETASPGYYSVGLERYGVTAEATASTRSGMMRFTFPAGQGNILLNLGTGLTNESGATLRRVSDTEVEGVKLLGTFCYNPQAVFPVYFVMRLNKVPAQSGYWKKQPAARVDWDWDADAGKYKLYTRYEKELSGDDVGAWFTFDAAEGEQIEVRMGVSFVSIENARLNLQAETGGKTFDELHAAARGDWNDHLGRIRVEGGSDDRKTVFYTALYHTLIHPSVLNDVNGEYPMMESGRIGLTTGTRYTVFSLWDTYRNLHQLMTLVWPEKQVDMINSMIDMYREWGWMPKWELFGRETWTMEGDPSIPVIVDSWLKGLRGYDIETAYGAFIKSATMPGIDFPDEPVQEGGEMPDSYYSTLTGEFNRMRPDINDYIRLGYVPLRRQFDNSVSHALEYYIADYALSLLAGDLGCKDDAATFRKRSDGWRNYYSAEYGTLRPRLADGTFYSPFNPAQGMDFEPNPGFHEGSAWNYTFYVPHDPAGLAKAMGGQRKFVERLERVFSEGHYDPANEPDIAYPYLFSYFKGDEWRTQYHTRRLLDKYYSTQPDGIPGNDDAGTMSAWAVFNMMGFYPDCPGSPHYTLTSPVFDRVTIALDADYWPQDEIVIEVEKKSPEDIYIDDITLGGKSYKKYRISHKELTEAGKITFRLSSKHK